MHQYFKFIIFGHGTIFKTILSRTYHGLKFQCTKAKADFISGGLFLIISTHHSEMSEGTCF